MLQGLCTFHQVVRADALYLHGNSIAQCIKLLYALLFEVSSGDSRIVDEI